MTNYSPRFLNKNVFTRPGGISRSTTFTSAKVAAMNISATKGLTISAIAQFGIQGILL